MIRRIDIIDIADHNEITDRDLIPPVPIIHKANEGFDLDNQWVKRRDWIADRTPIFGAYTVILPGDRGGKTSTIRDQFETFARMIDPVWQPGMIAMIDWEAWMVTTPRGPVHRYGRPASAAEVVEFEWRFRERFGRLPAVYANPNETGMRAELDGWFAAWPGNRRYVNANYSTDADAIRLGAVMHQWTSRAVVPGFARRVDANTVLNGTAIRELAGLTSPEPNPVPVPPQEKDTDMKNILIRCDDPGLTGLFTIDGHPVPPEVRDAALTLGWPVVDLREPTHTHWKEATLAKMGEQARRAYGDTPAR